MNNFIKIDEWKLLKKNSNLRVFSMEKNDRIPEEEKHRFEGIN